MKAVLFSDGGSRGNPGPAGIGYTIQSMDKIPIYESGMPIGRATNNVAEYKALIQGINKAVELGINELEVYIDSQLIEKQIKGIYKVKSPDLLPYFIELKQMITKLDQFQISHIRREFNKRADALVNEALDLNKEVVYQGNEEESEVKITKLKEVKLKETKPKEVKSKITKPNQSINLIQTYLELGGVEIKEINQLDDNIVLVLDKKNAKIVIEKLSLIRDMIKDTDQNVLLDVR